MLCKNKPEDILLQPLPNLRTFCQEMTCFLCPALLKSTVFITFHYLCIENFLNLQYLCIKNKMYSHDLFTCTWQCTESMHTWHHAGPPDFIIHISHYQCSENTQVFGFDARQREWSKLVLHPLRIRAVAASQQQQQGWIEALYALAACVSARPLVNTR